MRALACVLSLVCAPALAAPERLSVGDPHARVREALAAGDAVRARELLGERDGKAPTLVSAPGLYGRALELGGERELACEWYALDAREHPERDDAAWLRAARCFAARGEGAAALAAWERVLSSSVLRDVALVDEALRAMREHGAREGAANWAARASRLLLEASAPQDTLRREALARALLVVARGDHEGDARRALERLYVDLGETAPAREALALPGAKDLARHRDRALAMRRAEVLTERHDNAAVFATLSPHKPKGDDVSEEACAIRVMWGKAARKLRRYQDARAALDVAAERCGGDAQRRARYLAAQVAYYQSSPEAPLLLEQFAAAYPSDSFTDDVWFWRAELYERSGRLDEAVAAYQRVVDEHAAGDMREDARFNLAFLLARRADAAGARAILDEIARTAREGAVAVRDRALYWRARLWLYPDPLRLEPTADKAAQKAAHDELVAFAAARPASYYGHLARLLALHASDDVGADVVAVKRALDAAAPSRRETLDERASIPVGPLLARSEAFAHALAYAAAGYDDEAELLLDAIDFRALDDDGRQALALLFLQVGARDRAHQVMRFSGNALLSGKPAAASLVGWHVAFPRAHEDALEGAARSVVDVPGSLLMGLAREESAFDADVVSWAGAIGLCQLMPPTAKEEAGLLGLGHPSLDELRQPRLNARLGANHLARRMALYGHPLLAIAAYNAGPGNVAKWRGKGAPRPVDAWVESIPVEQTRLYVKKVTGSWVVYEALDGEVARVSFPLLLP